MDTSTRKDRIEKAYGRMRAEVDRILPPEIPREPFIKAVQVVIDHYLHAPEVPE